MIFKPGDNVVLNPKQYRSGYWTYKDGVIYTVKTIREDSFDTKEQYDMFVDMRYWILAKEENEI